MSLHYISAALMTGVKTILERATVDGGLGNPPVKWPNMDLVPPNKAFWVEVAQVPSDSVPATLGLGGEDLHTGFVQVTLNHPVQTGNGASWAAGDKLRNYFHSGASFLYEGVEVKVTKASMTQPIKKGSCLTAYVSIYYTSRTKRPTSPTTSP